MPNPHNILYCEGIGIGHWSLDAAVPLAMMSSCPSRVNKVENHIFLSNSANSW